MFNNFYFFFQILCARALGEGLAAADLTAKVQTAAWGLAAAFLVVCIFGNLYHFYFRDFTTSLSARRLLGWSVGLLGIIFIVKCAIFYFAKGYIPDRFLFYAIPSPKVLGWPWLLLAGIIAGVFFKFRRWLEAQPIGKFLLLLWLFFVIFGVSVAASREGLSGVYEPFTRTHWEYASDLPLVQGVSSFLRDYVSLIPQLSVHGATHPPGYALGLHILQKIFGVGLLGLALLVGAIGGLTIFPLYFFWREFADKEEIKRGLQIFVFLPSVVMFSFASMEAIFMFCLWLAIAIVYIGWRRSDVLSLVGGLFLGAALLCNFLFFLLFPLFLILLWAAYRQNRDKGISPATLARRLILSQLGFVGFFALLCRLTSYSIVENFIAAHAFNQELVRSNFESLGTYVVYFLMNIAAFAFYLGVANVKLWLGRWREILDARARLIYKAGLIMLSLFLLIGIFQGEVERIWLFLTPLMAVLLGRLLRTDEGSSIIPALLSLSVLQILLTQILFYTYW